MTAWWQFCTLAPCHPLGANCKIAARAPQTFSIELWFVVTVSLFYPEDQRSKKICSYEGSTSYEGISKKSLGDNDSTQELRKLVAGILRNLDIDKDTRQEIGHMQVLITRLIKAFRNSDRTSSTDVDCLMPKVAGQALAMLALENVHSCLVMLKEPEFINELKKMIVNPDDKYIYGAASLLCNLCAHAQPEQMESDLKELPRILQKLFKEKCKKMRA
uniref:Armadillo repeat-containing domain-containing protein n=1 Tax=Oryza brachyantha TaxID=4533 RepID=J3MNL6_ORYBR